jgi:hypothetical protein
MRPPGWLIRTISGRLEAKQLAAHRDAERVQSKLLMGLVTLYRDTEIGRHLGLPDVRSPAQFRERVAVRSALDYVPFWNRVIDDNRAGLLHPKALGYACVSSGTSGEEKYIPCPEEQIRSYRTFVNHAFFHAFHMLADYTLMAERMLITSGPPIKEVRPNGLVIGFGSGVATAKSSGFARKLVLPTPEILALTDTREKLRRTIEQALLHDVRVLTGIPIFVLPLLEELLRQAREQNPAVRSARDVWPNLRLYSFSGSPVGLYQARLRELLGEGVEFYEVYSSTECPVAYQYRKGEPGLIVDLSAGYFEFLPVGGSQRLPIHEVELGVVYELIVSSPAGAFAYKLGDRVEFVSKQPYLLRFAGREREEISLGGEKVTLTQARAALDHACAGSGARVRQFFVCPTAITPGERATHHWHVDFEREPADRERWLGLLDAHLGHANANYQHIRSAMPPPRLTVLPACSVQRYIEGSTMFGQGKFLNLYNSREIAQKLGSFTAGAGLSSQPPGVQS